MELVQIMTAAGGVAGLASLYHVWRTSSSVAKKNEVCALTEIVKALQAENERLHSRIKELRSERQVDRERIAVLEQINSQLWSVLRKHRLVPDSFDASHSA